MPLASAKAMFRKRLVRKWGLYVHRAWAHLLLCRSAAMAGGGGDADAGFAAAGSNEDDVYMEYNHVHPDRGYYRTRSES